MTKHEATYVVERVKSGQERPYADSIDVWTVTVTETDYKGETGPAYTEPDDEPDTGGTRCWHRDRLLRHALVLCGVDGRQSLADYRKASAAGDADGHFRGYAHAEITGPGVVTVTSCDPSTD